MTKATKPLFHLKLCYTVVLYARSCLCSIFPPKFRFVLLFELLSSLLGLVAFTVPTNDRTSGVDTVPSLYRALIRSWIRQEAVAK